MNWIMISVVAGSIVTSGHETKEQCEGRAAIVRETLKTAMCVQMPPSYSSNTYCTNCSLQLTPTR